MAVGVGCLRDEWTCHQFLRIIFSSLTFFIALFSVRVEDKTFKFHYTLNNFSSPLLHTVVLLKIDGRSGNFPPQIVCFFYCWLLALFFGLNPIREIKFDFAIKPCAVVVFFIVENICLRGERARGLFAQDKLEIFCPK